MAIPADQDGIEAVLAASYATHPDACRLGMGRAVYQACAAQADAVGIEVFECWSSLAAVSFYTRLGFKTQAPMDVRLPSDVLCPAVVMTRPLVPKEDTAVDP